MTTILTPRGINTKVFLGVYHVVVQTHGSKITPEPRERELWVFKINKHQYHPPQSNQSSMEDLMKAFIIKTDERLETHGITI